MNSIAETLGAVVAVCASPIRWLLQFVPDEGLRAQLAALPDVALAIPAPAILLVAGFYALGRGRRTGEAFLDDVQRGAATVSGGRIAMPAAAATDRHLDRVAHDIAAGQQAGVQQLAQQISEIQEILRKLQERDAQTNNTVIASPESDRRFAESLARDPALAPARDRILEGDFDGATEAVRDVAQKTETSDGDAASAARSAQVWRDLGRLEASRNVKAAVSAYEKARAIDPDHFWTLYDLSRLYEHAGDLAKASEAAQLASKAAGGGRERSAAFLRLGDISRAQGSRADAAQSYEHAIEAARSLSAANPGALEYLRDLAAAHQRLGVTLEAEGRLGAARAAYQEALKVSEDLAVREPTQKRLQSDIATCHIKIGDICLSEAKPAEAHTSFERALTIRKALVASEPGNAAWRRDLTISYDRIGNALVSQAKRAEALEPYRNSLEIRRTLAQQDPGNATHQRDLSVTLIKLGSALKAQGEHAKALEAFNESTEIREALAARHPGDASDVHALYAAYVEMGGIYLAEGDKAAAQTALRKGLSAAETLAARDPSDANWQLALVTANLKSGEASGDAAHYQRALDAALALDARGALSPRNAPLIDILRKRLAGPGNSTSPAG